ncbi:hypothetical protein ACHQM5_003975 [Ranunculus cassubicifolius]
MVWLVDISQWNPSREQFSFILSTLPSHEHSSITRFIHFIDQKRSLVSRLLQYSLIHQLTNLPFDKIIINRTVESKPYFEHTPNFNFNTSHDGDYVGIVSEPFFIIGLDIVSLITPKQETPIEFVQNFVSHFTSNEWEDIIGGGDVMSQFCRYWCLKEAFIKAIGSGLGFTLRRLEFKHSDWNNVVVFIDGVESREWEFSISGLGKNHFVSVARGHPRDAVENYKRTLRVTEIVSSSNVEFMSKFVVRTVEELLPASFRAEYSKCTGC